MLRFAIFACLCACVFGHSWLTCTDYLEENGDYYEEGLCRAYPRSALRFAPKGILFGRDTGFNHQPDENSVCKTPRNDGSNYDFTHHVAVYYPGQKVILTHPVKNHVASTCTNQWIPDNQNKILVGPRNANTDLSLSAYKQREIIDLGVSKTGQQWANKYPRPGYQNAAKFCENMDKALATLNFYLPNMQPGRYTFVWLWEFNKNGYYTSCWEADVVASKSERDAKLRQRGQLTSDPVNVAPGGVSYVGTKDGPIRTVNGPVSVGGGGGRPATNSPPVVTSVGGRPATNSPTVVTRPPIGVVTARPSGNRPINGGWGSWSQWSECDKKCGGGVERQTRHCNNPLPQNGGAMCSGSDEQTRTCNTQQCPPGVSGSGNTIEVKYTSYWGSGANGAFYPSASHKKVMLKFPCPPHLVQFWHATDISTSTQKQSGVFVLTRSSWQLDKQDVGFTVHFGSCSALKDRKTIVVIPM